MNKKLLAQEFKDFILSDQINAGDLIESYYIVAEEKFYIYNENINNAILNILKNECGLNIKGDITIGKLKHRGIKVEVVHHEGYSNVVDVRIKQRGKLLLYKTIIANFL